MGDGAETEEAVNTRDANFDPEGKVAVITGAAGGIGLGMARAFTDAGMSVVIADIDADRIEAAANGLREAGFDAIGVQTDVSKFDDVQALADAAMDTHGRVDVLCNNAGAAIFSKLFNVTVDDWEWTLGIDLWGPIYGTKVFQPLIQKSENGGHINTSRGWHSRQEARLEGERLSDQRDGPRRRGPHRARRDHDRSVLDVHPPQVVEAVPGADRSHGS